MYTVGEGDRPIGFEVEGGDEVVDFVPIVIVGDVVNWVIGVCQILREKVPESRC